MIKILQQLGKNIKKYRIDANLTQTQLAEKVGLSTNFIGMVERAERNTKVSNLFKFSQSLDVPIATFFDFD